MSALAKSLDPATRRRFRQRLLRWFGREQHKLHWRGETDPYRILLSEIMLQQTRVAVVEERYRLCLEQAPSVDLPARAREEPVPAAWSGLGCDRPPRSRPARSTIEASRNPTPRSADGW